MKAYSINPQTQTVKELDIEIQIDTAYSFFKSLLIDESLTINNHVVLSDANALNEGKKPFMIGGQLILGEALVIGRDGLEDIQASIPQKDLELLINYEIPEFYTQVIELVRETNINFFRTFNVDKSGEKIELNIEWVLYTFNIADEKTQEYFITNLKDTLAKEEDVVEYMKKMAQLAVNAI